jgi:hypothetical protein
VVKNERISVELTRRDVFGTDEKARNDQLASLYNQDGTPSKELEAIADFSVLMDSLLEFPNAADLAMVGAGRTGVHHHASLLLRIYCEQEYLTPIAKQRAWWKSGSALRDEMRRRITSQVGNEAAASCILNCYDILYRKFIRRVLVEGTERTKNLLHGLAKELSAPLFNSGAALFINLLRVETRKKKVETEVLPTKGKKPQKVYTEEKYLARIRPSILDGPKTPFEAAAYAKVNTALAKIDRCASGYDLTSKKYSSPVEWEEVHRLWIEDLYRKAKMPSHIMVQRKKTIRANIIAQMDTNSTTKDGKSSGIVSTEGKITSAQWMKAEGDELKAHSDDFDKVSLDTLNEMLGSKTNKSGILEMTEADIIDRLCPKSGL